MSFTLSKNFEHFFCCLFELQRWIFIKIRRADLRYRWKPSFYMSFKIDQNIAKKKFNRFRLKMENSTLNSIGFSINFRALLFFCIFVIFSVFASVLSVYAEMHTTTLHQVIITIICSPNATNGKPCVCAHERSLLAHTRLHLKCREKRRLLRWTRRSVVRSKVYILYRSET